MKKTNIFIAGICLLAAIICVAATRANTKTSFTYYIEVAMGDPTSCISIVLDNDPHCSIFYSTPCDITILPFGIRELFLVRDADGNCKVPLSLD